MTRYRTIPDEIFYVDVEKIIKDRTVIMTGSGEITGDKGDFIVMHPDGVISVLRPDYFHEIYELPPED